MAHTEIPPAEQGVGADEVRLLSDTPLDADDQDTLGLGVLAEALAELVDSARTDTPLTIAISAPWGAGKTSTARLIETRLQRWSAQRHGERVTVVCKFNAWLHSDAPHLGAALAAAVARTVDHRRPWWRRALTPLPSSMLVPAARRRRLVVIAVGTLVVSAAAMFVGPVRDVFTGSSSAGLSDDAVARLGPLVVAVAAVALLWRRLFSAAQAAARFIEQPADEASHGSMATVREQLGGLIGEAIGDGRLVIFIDDLERCRADRALEACEVATQLLAHRGVVIVLVADMTTIASSAGARYPSRTGGEADAGRRFLEKLIQIQITLPPPRERDLERLLAGVPPQHEPARGPEEPPAAARKSGWAVWRLGPRPLLAMVGVALLIGFVAGNGPASADETLAVVAGWVLFVTGFLAATSLATRAIERMRTRRRLHAIDAAIATVKDTTTADELEASVLERVTPGARAKDAGQVPQLVRQQVRSYLIHESEQLKEVEGFIRVYAPRLPRGAKRMLNHARVLTRVAIDRGVLSGEDVTPEHLGKWIVFSERWVELADRVKEEPAEMSELEAAAREGHLDEALARSGTPVASQQQLALLLERPPELGAVVERLIGFEPAR